MLGSPNLGSGKMMVVFPILSILRMPGRERMQQSWSIQMIPVKTRKHFNRMILQLIPIHLEHHRVKFQQGWNTSGERVEKMLTWTELWNTRVQKPYQLISVSQVRQTGVMIKEIWVIPWGSRTIVMENLSTALSTPLFILILIPDRQAKVLFLLLQGKGDPHQISMDLHPTLQEEPEWSRLTPVIIQ